MSREELDFDHREMTARGGEADKNLAVRFYKMPVRNEQKSAEEGRPIYEELDMCEVRVRGDRNNINIRPVRPEDKKRFRDAWADYKDGVEQKLTGTPLSQWPPMSSSMVEEMRYLHFFTVEQLADANDDVVMRVPGLSTLRNSARAYLELSKGAAPVERLTKELAAEKSAREAADAQVAALAARLDALEKATKGESAMSKVTGGNAVRK